MRLSSQRLLKDCLITHQIVYKMQNRKPSNRLHWFFQTETYVNYMWFVILSVPFIWNQPYFPKNETCSIIFQWKLIRNKIVFSKNKLIIFMFWDVRFPMIDVIIDSWDNYKSNQKNLIKYSIELNFIIRK